jgi:hypothetical protein
MLKKKARAQTQILSFKAFSLYSYNENGLSTYHSFAHTKVENNPAGMKCVSVVATLVNKQGTPL